MEIYDDHDRQPLHLQSAWKQAWSKNKAKLILILIKTIEDAFNEKTF